MLQFQRVKSMGLIYSSSRMNIFGRGCELRCKSVENRPRSSIWGSIRSLQLWSALWVLLPGHPISPATMSARKLTLLKEGFGEGFQEVSVLGSWAGGTPRGRGVVEAPGDCGCDARKIGRSRVHREHQHGRAGLPPRHRVLFSRSTILTDTEKLIPRPMIFTCYQGSLLGFPLSLSFWRAFCAYGNLERMNSFKSTADLVVASAGEDCKNSLWMKNGQTTRVVPQPDGETNDNIDESILGICFSSKGSRYLGSGGTSKIVREWDIQRRRCIKWLEGHIDTITGVPYNCEDEHLASINMKGDLIIHNLASSTKTAQLKDPHNQVLRVMEYSQLNRHLLLTAGNDVTIHLWDTTALSPKLSWLKQH